jgi:hypothetical protein
MVIREPAAVFTHLPDEGIALLVVVVEMYLDIADSEAHYFGYVVEQVATILLLRVENAVLGALTCGVSGSVVRNTRPILAPLRHAGKRGFN